MLYSDYRKIGEKRVLFENIIILKKVIQDFYFEYYNLRFLWHVADAIVLKKLVGSISEKIQTF